MKIKVGDQVKFLNERGGGVVSKILNSTMVNVAIEDGFEIPTRISELIKIDDITGPGGFLNKSSVTELQPETTATNEYEPETKIVPLVRFAAGIQYPPGVYLAFAPQDQKWLLTGLIDIRIINYTSYEVLLNLYLKNPSGSYAGVDYDVIPADSLLLLETIQREEIEEWCQGVIQLMFHRDQDTTVLMPVSTTFRIKPVKFYKDVHFQSSNLLQERALIYTLHQMSKVIDTAVTIPEGKKEPATPELPRPSEAQPQALIDKHGIAPRTAEVDLHISSLVDDYSGLKKQEILTIQTRYFSDCLDSALQHHYYRIFFIHGIGNGTLKKAILELLNDFGGLEFHEAPLQKYGAGAIEVIIPDNQ